MRSPSSSGARPRSATSARTPSPAVGAKVPRSATPTLADAGTARLTTRQPPDLGLLIGKHGQTIDAIQYLANAAVWRGRGDERKAVVVDAAGYRARREATLEALANRSAERAISSARSVELDPMTAVERKVVHLALKETAGVVTRSEGAEPNRFVVVLPRRSAD